MRGWSAIAIFCEDIREEKSGQDTLIGILPDSLRVPSVPGAMPKLGVYTRIVVERDTNIQKIGMRLETPDGTVYQMADLTEVLKRGRDESERGRIGLVSKAVFAPMPIQGPGEIKAIASIDGEDFICGSLGVIVASPHATSFSAIA